MNVTSSRRSGRTVFAAIGAAVAVALGAGGVVHYANAAPSGSGSTSSFVPIAPCRLIDTRPATIAGPRAVPLAGGTANTWSVWGQNGNCSIPADATAVTLNVTIANPTADGYLMLWPTDQPQPTASNLNWVAGQAPTPNAVTVSLSAAGQLSTFNNAGTVDVIVDVAGYFTALEGTSIVERDYAAARYVFTGRGCSAGAGRVIAEDEWGVIDAFPDLPCVQLPVFQNAQDFYSFMGGGGSGLWNAPLPARPSWVTTGDSGGSALDLPSLPVLPGLDPAAQAPTLNCSFLEISGVQSVGCSFFFGFSNPTFPFDSASILAYSDLSRTPVMLLSGEQDPLP